MVSPTIKQISLNIAQEIGGKTLGCRAAMGFVKGGRVVFSFEVLYYDLMPMLWLHRKIWVVFGVLVNIAGTGMIVSYPSSLLPGLRAPGSGIEVSLEAASWLASAIGFSTIIGFFSSSICMELFGRRRAHILMIIPAIVGWIIIYVAGSITVLLIGRIFCGISAGATVTLGAVVIGEYTSPENRGVFLNLKTTSAVIGILTVHISANYLHWRTVALISTIPFVVAIINIFTWCESPSWLISKRRFEESEENFFYIRGRTEKSVKEFQALLLGQKDKFADKTTFKEGVVILAKKFTEKDFIKPVAIIFACFCLLEACGRHYFASYASDIIESITGDRSQSFLYTISIDIITAISATASSILIKLTKRRTLLFTSGITSLLILLSVSIYLYLSSLGVVSKDKTWIPLSMLIMFYISANLGCTPIPLALPGELFPLRHRAAGLAVGGVIISIVLLICLKVVPSMLFTLKVHGAFAVFAVIIGLSLGYLYFTLPETKDRTLQDIEDYFKHGRFLTDVDIRNNKEESVKLNSEVIK